MKNVIKSDDIAKSNMKTFKSLFVHLHFILEYYSAFDEISL